MALKCVETCPRIMGNIWEFMEFIWCILDNQFTIYDLKHVIIVMLDVLRSSQIASELRHDVSNLTSVIPSCSSLRECRFHAVSLALHGTTSFLHHSMPSMPILESLRVGRDYKATARFLHTKCLSVRLGERLNRLCLLCFTLVASVVSLLLLYKGRVHLPFEL